MGLDQYAYVAARQNQHEDFFDGAKFDPEKNDYVNEEVAKPREIAYWRKHPNLHGWMEKLWREKENPPSDQSFNGIELELTWEDLEDLERAITHDQLPYTEGFFFGSPADDYYKDQDLAFIREARSDLFLGLKVFYNSSW